jgi:MFS family permease
VFGRDLPQTWLAVGATASLAAGLAVLLVTAPSLPGAVVFAILFGMGSGLMSIVGGTLPLELFGRVGYGGYVGWVTAARQFTTALAPFGLTLLISAWGVFPALWTNLAIGALGMAVFTAIALVHRRARRRSAPTQSGLLLPKALDNAQIGRLARLFSLSSDDRRK